MSLTALLLILLVLFLVGGFWGRARFGLAGFSPVGLLVIVLVILYFTGHLHL